MNDWSASPSCAAGSPVSPSPSLAAAVAKTTSCGSGPSSPGSFAAYDHPSCSWRTSQVCLDGALETFSENWPPAGTMRNGTVFQRQRLVPRISGIGSSLLPTPTSDTGARSRKYAQGGTPLGLRAQTWPTPVHKPGGGSVLDGGSNSRRAAKTLGAWPTPTARDWKDGSPNPNVPVNGLLGRAIWPTPTVNGNYNRPGSSPTPGLGLRMAVTWATPKASPSGPDGSGGDDLATQIGGPLNPPWVEWLMGFPLGWTDCGPSATRSSRKSRSGSAGGSARSRKRRTPKTP